MAAVKLTDEQVRLIEAARQEQGVRDLENLPALALRIGATDTFDPTNAQDYTRTDAFEITPVVHPLMAGYLLSIGARPQGDRTFEISATQRNIARLERAVRALPHDLVLPAEHAAHAERRRLSQTRYVHAGSDVARIVRTTDAGSQLHARGLDLYMHYNHRRYRTSPEGLRAVIYMSAGIGRIYVKFATVGTGRYAPWSFAPTPGSDHHLGLMRHDDVRDPMRVAADIAVREALGAKEAGWSVLDPDGLLDDTHAGVSRFVGALGILGSPGQARIVIGNHSTGIKSFIGTMGQVSQVVAQADPHMMVGLDAQVTDALALYRANPAACDGLAKPLRPFQAKMVGLHLAGSIGMLNGCAPGTGKTIMTLAAFRERGLAVPGWKGLCVVPKQVVSQWAAEARECFPQAHVAVLAARALPARLDEARAQAQGEGRPLLVIVSFDAMRRNIDTLEAQRWDDLACDEAAFLSSPGTARTKAMWRLRKAANVAVALTGTPIDRSLDDMGSALAWARNQPDMFVGQRRLSRRFDVTDPESVTAMWRALGETVYRRDRSEIAGELPQVSTMPLLLDPEPAERALADGARTELRRMYDQLLAATEAAASIDPDDPDLAEAYDELRSARGAVLGGVTLARAACCDPQAVRASASAGAALLDAAGLIDPAVASGGTKRREIVKLVAQQTAAGEAVLIFTDFATVCASMAQALADAGVRVATYSGKDTDRARQEAVRAFMAGELDCLVLTGAGREGLNLQRASVVIHYDLPWIPSQVVQRVGRASRIGSSASKLQALIPILAGTIEERVAAVLVPRAATAMMALDVHRGVCASDTETGMAVAGLTEVVSEGEITGKESMFDMARAILAA